MPAVLVDRWIPRFLVYVEANPDRREGTHPGLHPSRRTLSRERREIADLQERTRTEFAKRAFTRPGFPKKSNGPVFWLVRIRRRNRPVRGRLC